MVLLCSVSDANGTMQITEIATSPLTQDLLNHDVSAPSLFLSV